MELTHELREHSGLQWVLDRLVPLSPFGRAAARAPRWYGPGEEAALADELDNLALSLSLWDAKQLPEPEEQPCCCDAPKAVRPKEPPLRGVTRCLPLFHDIRGSFDRDPGNPFDLVELFEIKHFLVTLEQVQQAYAALPPFAGIAFPPMDAALALVDPDGRRLPAFSVLSSYHPGLGPLREQKARLEKTIRAASEAEKPALLEQRRELAVREDQLELLVRRDLTCKLMEYKADFLANMDALGRLDLIFAKTKLARAVRLPPPRVLPGRLRHPARPAPPPGGRRTCLPAGKPLPRWIWN